MPTHWFRRGAMRALMTLVATCAGLVGVGRAAQAQDDAGAGAGAAVSPRAAGASQVQVQVRSFGVGGGGRPGDWAGIYVEILDSTDKPRNVIVRLDSPDVDGDTTWVQRPVLTTPGERRGVWLYTRVSSSYGSAVYPIEVYEANEVNGVTDPRLRHTPGRLLGQTRYASNASWSPYSALCAIVGKRDAGLRQYDWMVSQSRGEPITGNEPLESVTVGPGDLPDRWMGLAAFESIVWTGAGSDEQPALLRPEQADAIREWVRRGGHFIVVLPPVSQSWVAMPSNPLADIMPRVRVERRENVDLNLYRTLLTRDKDVRLPTDAVIHIMDPEGAGGAGPYDAMSIMAGNDGGSVVMRRLVGAGAVTVVGLDIVSPKLHSLTNSFQADQFWNRVLGKRCQLIHPQVLIDQMAGKWASNKTQLWTGSRQSTEFDLTSIAKVIAKSGSAGAGVLLALVVFAAYWVLAGPGGFFMLKRRGLTRFAWLVFVGAGVLFTGIGWSGANALKTRRVEGKHVTFVDIVYGQPIQRARSWMTLFLPSYGQERVSVAPGNSAAGSANLLWPWAPAQGGSTIAAFPDARGYVMDARSPDTADFPARATVKQVQVDWAGGLPAGWGVPIPAAALETPIGSEIRVVSRTEPVGDAPLPGEEPTNRGQRVAWRIQGVLTHTLPKPLKDVTVIYLREPEAWNAGGDRVPFQGWAMNFRPPQLEPGKPALWEPGTPLDLGLLFAEANRSAMSRDRVDDLLKSLRGEASTTFGQVGLGQDLDNDTDRAMRGLTLFSMLPPPGPNDQSVVLPRRRSTHGYDLGRWFTQPCIIVIGELEDSDVPVSVSVDSQGPDELRKRIKGGTIVRWIYPLPPSPFKPGVVESPTPPLGGEGWG